MPLQEGQQIGQYRIVEQLGQGGMAMVYKAYHARLDRYVAIKVMHQALLDDPTFKARFAREAQIVARLEHPNIIPVYDFDEYEGQPFLVLKEVEGRTLKMLMTDAPLSLSETVRIMSAVANALTYAHQRGVLHRDIKPSNIIIDPEGTPYLTDFGLARMVQSGSSTMSADMLLGTPHYISPEQAKGESDLDARTDVYSFGVVLYEIILGRVPFTGTTPYAIVHDHIYSPVPLPSAVNPNIPPEVEAVLLKALSKNAADRYNSPTELMQALRAALTGVTHIEPAPPEAMTSDPSVATRSLSEQPAPPPAVNTRPLIDFKVPDGQKRFVQIPTPPPAPVDNSLDSVFREVGSRFKEIGLQLKEELERSGVVDEIKRQVEVARSQSEQGRFTGIQSPIQYTPAQRAVDEEWGSDEKAVRRRAQERIGNRGGVVSHTIAYIVVITILTLIWGQVSPLIVSSIGSSPAWLAQLIQQVNVPVVIALGWGVGLANHFVDFLSKTSGRVQARRRAIFRQMERIYGDNWQQDASDKQYKRVRRSVMQRFENRIGFFHHFITYIMTLLFISTIWFNAMPALQAMAAAEAPDAMPIFGFPVPLLVALFWGIGLVFNGIGVLFSPLIGDEAEARALESEMERERSRISDLSVGKRKNVTDAKLKNEDLAVNTPPSAPRVRLTEEGELTDSFAQEISDQERRQNQ
ncbi:MAG: protein kinase [Anaerolineae bacterium]